MPIVPLPQFEADVAEYEREKLIAALIERGHDEESISGLDTDDLRSLQKKAAPTTLVVRFGAMRMIGEFPYRGDVTPGCGSKLVVRTHRGVEIGEMLTSTCANAGCGSSITRKQMLEYIERSGGRQYPFTREGRVLRVATAEDLKKQAALEQSRHGLRLGARALAESLGLRMKIVEAEPILGGDRITFYYTSEDRVDFRELVRELSAKHRVRIDMRQVGSRDEARLTADYEKCGQYCCCKSFLKVLKPVNMKSAKVQKATLDPIKISGRCGRLMCCLRYEDETYEQLARRLPRRKARVGTPDGDGVVLNTQILTQLVLVRLDESGESAAYPVEEIGAPGERKTPPRDESVKQKPRRAASGRAEPQPRDEPRPPVSREPAGADGSAEPMSAPVKKKRRRRRRRRASAETGAASPAASTADGRVEEPTGGDHTQAPGAAGSTEKTTATGKPDENSGTPVRKKRRRRKRRRRHRDGTSGTSPGDDAGPTPESGGPVA